MTEFIAGKGNVTKWERLRRQNHWFDTLYNACAAANACGVRLVQEQLPPPPPQPARRQENTSEFAGWLDCLDRENWMNR